MYINGINVPKRFNTYTIGSMIRFIGGDLNNIEGELMGVRFDGRSNSGVSITFTVWTKNGTLIETQYGAFIYIDGVGCKIKNVMEDV